ncbi:MAG TPA: dephospho-CoA kinase [Chthoniobacteraceae bacterium]|nr:dephospho-CoA kinase [Chthoniobacteraceae bacterium]
MPVVGLTGGIATGKSAFARLLLQHLPAAFFDADACSRELLRGDPQVIASIREKFGPAIIAADGGVIRSRLRDLVFADAGQRRLLESVLHPPIRASWTALSVEARQAGTWLLVDIPLLYETQAESQCDGVIVVACSDVIQLGRLQTERALPLELAKRIVAAQLPLAIKVHKADHLIWNDSTISCLGAQAELIAGALQHRYA